MGAAFTFTLAVFLGGALSLRSRLRCHRVRPAIEVESPHASPPRRPRSSTLDPASSRRSRRRPERQRHQLQRDTARRAHRRDWDLTLDFRLRWDFSKTQEQLGMCRLCDFLQRSVGGDGALRPRTLAPDFFAREKLCNRLVAFDSV